MTENPSPTPEHAGATLSLGDLERGMLVTWPEPYASQSSSKPVGRIVTKEDRPLMAADEAGPFLIAVLDNDLWLFSPYQVMAKGSTLWRYEGPIHEVADAPSI